MRTVAVRSGTPLVGVAITLAISVAAGCRQPAAPAPLRTRPATALPPETEWIVGHLKELQALTPAARATLADQWRPAADDLPGTEKVLLITAQIVAGESPDDRARRTALRRQVILWLIDHQPGHFVHQTPYAMLSSRSGDPDRDPEGYRAAAQQWQRQASRADASAAALGNAARFFKASDPGRAESLLIRARNLEPDNETWSETLGNLYGEALSPPPSIASQRPSNADVVPVETVLAARAREYLSTTQDARILFAVGRAVLWHAPVNSVRRAVALEYLTRARAIDPKNRNVAQTLNSLEFGDWSRRLNARLAGKPRESWTAAVADLPPTDRLRALIYLACSEYMNAENMHWGATRPRTEVERRQETVTARRAEASLSLSLSRAWAQQALALADQHRGSSVYPDVFFYSHIVLGINALRDGDHATARRHLLHAPTGPISTTPDAMLPTMGRALEQRFIAWLLKDGERERVATYFERLGTTRPDAQVRLQRAAKDLRDGYQPRDYFRDASIYASRSGL